MNFLAPTCHSTISSSSSSSSSALVIRSKKHKPRKNSGQAPAPPRITSNVKQNLQFLRSWKEHERRNRNTGSPRPATSYRKKKIVKEQLPNDEDIYRDPTLNLYYTKKDLETSVPVLLVDGYNVCGYWEKLKKHFFEGDLAAARRKLIDELITFSAFNEVKVVVVFDAFLSGRPTHKETFASIDIVFSGETSADSWIENEVTALKADGCPKVWVATSDLFHQQAAYGAGAFIWSCKTLISEINASQKELEEFQQQQRLTSMQGRLLKNNLDAEVVQALKDLRRQLAENEANNLR